MKGLDKIGYPYVVNKRLDACKRLWIHDDRVALNKIAGLPTEIKVIVGPNLYDFPRDIPDDVDISRAIYIHPSEAAKEFWEHSGFKKCPLDAWPTGIDTNDFYPDGQKKELVLVYFKQRLDSELKSAEDLLKEKKIKYEALVCYSYQENEYKRLLQKAKYIFWIGRGETQGIALEEALATDVPILIWDVSSLKQCTVNIRFTDRELKYLDATSSSAPYFSGECGLKVKDFSELGRAVDFMEQNWQNLHPRKYILENLSLEKQAKDMVMLYEKHFGLEYEDGFREKILRRGNWLNNKVHYRLWLKAKHFTRIFLAKLKFGMS